MSENTTDTVEAKVPDKPKTDEKALVTPYKAAQAVNAELAKRGLKPIEPQRFYGFARSAADGKGPFPSAHRSETGKWYVEVGDVRNWLRNRLENPDADPENIVL